MTLTIHRSQPRQPSKNPLWGTRDDPREHLPAYAILWMCSLVSVILGLVDGDELGLRMMVSVIAVLVVPLLARDGITMLVRGARERSGHDHGHARALLAAGRESR